MHYAWTARLRQNVRPLLTLTRSVSFFLPSAPFPTRIRASAMSTAKTGGKKRSGQPSAYNIYMKVQLAKLKEEQEKSGKKIDHKENFKKVAADWKTAPENPKNKK
ncbi:hypothetical protein AYX13_05669 [Cryptococcus neoformans]|nr:hypothetical protein AYX13_05669 [Cryptococcus neoformans var. grubii]